MTIPKSAVKAAAKKSNEMQKELVDKAEDYHCVQCFEPLTHHIDDKAFTNAILVCTNEACPNFALLCVSLEKMPGFLYSRKTDET